MSMNSQLHPLFATVGSSSINYRMEEMEGRGERENMSSSINPWGKPRDNGLKDEITANA